MTVEAPGGLDWPGLMRAGIAGLGLRPAEFWALTPAELALMLGIDAGGGGAMTRARLAEMAAAYPDRPDPPAAAPADAAETSETDEIGEGG